MTNKLLHKLQSINVHYLIVHKKSSYKNHYLTQTTIKTLQIQNNQLKDIVTINTTHLFQIQNVN